MAKIEVCVESLKSARAAKAGFTGRTGSSTYKTKNSTECFKLILKP